MSQSLRILMVCHMPWDRNLGGARVQVELAEEFTRLGHQVTKFSYEDAFPLPQSRLGRQLAYFPEKARDFVRQNVRSFDIIDAQHGCLPYPKAELGFGGLLVARTVGFHDLAYATEQALARKWPVPQGNLVMALLRRWLYDRRKADFARSLHYADLCNLPNHDEADYVRQKLGLERVAVFPFGLTEARQQKFRAIAQPAAQKQQNQEVAFIGYWQIRKGIRDMGAILRQVRQQVPQARFLLLGTGKPAAAVLADLEMPAAEWLTIVPAYDSNDLPTLLAGTTVGFFPSYMEGFGFAVLEKLAAGAPTIAYDIPGPREMLRHLDPQWLVPVGDWQTMADRISAVLTLPAEVYRDRVQQCLDVAQIFSWRKIAHDTLAVYIQQLTALRA